MIERLVAVDWSGDNSLAGQKRKIWAGVWTRGTAVTLENGRSREELVVWLVHMARETPRMVVGVDFCFSYPAWFLRELGMRTAPKFWKLVANGHGERWLSLGCDDSRFWGRRGPARDGKTPAEFCGEARHRMFRRADVMCKIKGEILSRDDAAKVKGIAPKSPFQIGGAGAVGTGTLRGIPILRKLRREGFAVWPFDVPKLPMIVEIYPRLLTGEVKKSRAEDRAKYLADLKKANRSYRKLNDDILDKARGSEDAFDALVSVMVMASKRDDFLTLRQAEDAISMLEGAVWGAGV
jgi:hypothetical protein